MKGKILPIVLTGCFRLVGTTVSALHSLLTSMDDVCIRSTLVRPTLRLISEAFKDKDVTAIITKIRKVIV